MSEALTSRDEVAEVAAEYLQRAASVAIVCSWLTLLLAGANLYVLRSVSAPWWAAVLAWLTVVVCLFGLWIGYALHGDGARSLGQRIAEWALNPTRGD